MRAYADASAIAFSCCFILAVLATAAYARWHYWWRTGFGRARMALMASFAGLTLEQAVRGWTSLRASSTPDHIMNWIRVASAAVASGALAYLLISIISLNIQRARKPGFAAGAGRRHLERTPWASEEEIGKLTAAWDEMHGNPQFLPPSHPSSPRHPSNPGRHAGGHAELYG